MKQPNEIQGWFSEWMVYDYIVDYTPTNGTIVEVGAWLGKSSSYLCDISGDRNVIIVDSWMGSPDETDTHHTLVTKEDVYELFKKNMGDRNYQSIKGLSTEVAKQFDDESLDTVFIDATHTYEAVKEDITAWLPKIKYDGILAGHDYVERWFGVVTAVDELLPNRIVLDNCWIYHKR